MRLSFLRINPDIPKYHKVICDSPGITIDELFTTVYVQIEPEEFIPCREYLLRNWRLFYQIYTYDDILLEKCPNAVKYVFGNNMLGYIPIIDIFKKEFKVSSLTGDKDSLTGHKLRRTLYDNQLNFPHNFVFFVSHKATTLQVTEKNPVIYETKLPLFETFQFSIVIECSKQNNYFTEKLIDCLLTKTIPIYWGCPNIGHYFDTAGWIFFNNIDIPLLTPDHYTKYVDTIEKNYLKAAEYCSFRYNLIKSGLNITL